MPHSARFLFSPQSNTHASKWRKTLTLPQLTKPNLALLHLGLSQLSHLSPLFFFLYNMQPLHELITNMLLNTIFYLTPASAITYGIPTIILTHQLSLNRAQMCLDVDSQCITHICAYFGIIPRQSAPTTRLPISHTSTLDYSYDPYHFELDLGASWIHHPIHLITISRVTWACYIC